MVDGQPVLQFAGKEMFCEVDNKTDECLTAAWYHNPNNRAAETRVDNWSVVAYFATFTDQHRLPPNVLEDIDLVMEDDDIFLALAPND